LYYTHGVKKLCSYCKLKTKWDFQAVNNVKVVLSCATQKDRIDSVSLHF